MFGTAGFGFRQLPSYSLLTLNLMYKHVLNNKLRLTVCLSNEEFEGKFGS